MTVAEQLLDRRILERHIKNGLVVRKDFEKHLENLPDMASNAEKVIIDDPLHPFEDAETV